VPFQNRPGLRVVVGARVNQIITTPGIYNWQIVVQATLSGGGTSSQIYTGKALVWTNDNSSIGPGWSLAGMEHLYDSGTNGIMITRGSSNRPLYYAYNTAE